MGSSELTSRQMGDYTLLYNRNPKLTSVDIYQLAELYLNIGRMEGVRGDIAFAQSLLETGYFAYGGDVVPEQNNYSGIGTTGGGVKGAYFATPEIGVRAQIQHLKAYASKEPLVTELVDPRFQYVTRGIAPNWIDLNGRWAVPGIGYGEKILGIHSAMKKMTLSIPNTQLPSNHRFPVAKMVLRQDVPLINPQGKVERILTKGNGYRVYGVLGDHYDVGGGYLVKADSNKMGVYIGRALIKDNATYLYAPNGQKYRLIDKGAALRVYSYNDRIFDVGGSYYVTKSNNVTYYVGMVTIKADSTLYQKDGKPYRLLKKNERYRVYKIDGNKLDLGGGYYVVDQRNNLDYIN
ncbi:glucosaminidase domain-containing protein [Bacillus sp. FJAT-49870]|uniref:Glucosaminidase domain-containing protein n=2 Tax=Lederbergia citri TaxID=2833580 RepID=A0A942TDK9_9BACI|nr:glucosaminidase domain-containing protein [Lederbergia citri]